MSPVIRSALLAEIEGRGLPVVELPSGAGHDAGVLARAGVPSGMLFVRSLNGGVSHSPDELSSEEDIALAVDVLAGALAGNHFATIVEGKEQLRELGRRMLWEGAQEIVFTER